MTRPPEIIGHRGARGLFPENSLEGFQAALDLGCRHFELDVGVTADGVPVVTHDLALNPAITRDAAGAWIAASGPWVHDLTLAELQTFDVGRIRPVSAYRLAHRAQKGRDGVRIPTLDAVLRLSTEARFIVELKTDLRHPEATVPPAVMAELTLAAIDRAGCADRVTIESFDWRGPRHIRRLRPDQRLAWLTRPETVENAALWWDLPDPPMSVPAAVAAEGGRVWAPEHGSLSKQLLNEAHALDLEVIPWTVNRRLDIRRLARWGVDGLITDRPDIAFAELSGHSAML